MDSWIPSIIKKCIRIPVFLMYSDSEVQKLKVFGFGEISTSAKTNCRTHFYNVSLVFIMLEMSTPITFINPGESLEL